MATLPSGHPAGYRLQVVESTLPDLKGLTISLDGTATFGRNDDCTVPLKDRSVSRVHARIEPHAAGYRLVDNESANGVWIGETRVAELVLGDGVRFRIGETTFECRAPMPAASGPTPVEDGGTMLTTGLGFLLRVVESKSKVAVGTEYKVPGGKATLGRGEECSIVLADASASRLHARLDAIGIDRYRLSDNHSSNGLWLGDRKVSQVVLEPGQRFRVGDTVLEAHPLLAPKKAEAQGTQMMSGLGELLAKAAARRLEAEGEAVTVSPSRIVVLDDPGVVHYVVAGKIEIFTATFKEGRPLGARNHFLTLGPGDAFFGFDRSQTEDSGFLASGRGGTTVRRIGLERLQQLATDPETAELVTGLIERWVIGLSSRLVRDVFPRPNVDARVTAGAPAALLQAGARARAAEGLVWVELPAFSALFIGMSTLMWDGESMPFPLSMQTWLEPAGGTDNLLLQGQATTRLLRDPRLWWGLGLFHQALCECEFINKRLAVVDEYQRLSSKAKQSEAAKDAAYDAIGAVLAGQGQEPTDFGGSGKGEPVVQAFRLVGEVMGIKVKTPPEARQERTLEDHLASIAAASRCRTRKVVLYGQWWTRDNGPLLGRTDKTATPVALLPRGIGAYELVDPAAGTRVVVDEKVAADLHPFAYVLYRGFPVGSLGVRELLSFGARGLGSDLRTLLAMGVVTGLLGAATPFLTGQMIDSAIPQSERGLLLQLGLAMLLVAVATSLFKVVQSVAVVRVESRMDYILQAALWDRLLDLPSAFFRRYGSGDLADRANGINQIRGLVSRAGVGGILGSISSVFYLFLMLFYNIKLAMVAIAISLVLVAVTTLGNYIQLQDQRQEQLMRGRISSLVLQLIAGVSKVRVSAAENHAFRVWAQRFSEQRRISLRIGYVQNTVATFSASFSVLSTLGIFAALWYFQTTAAPGEAMAFSAGTFIAFNSAFGSFVTAMQSLAESSLSLLRAVPVFERLKPILEEQPESDESKSHPGRLRGEIALSNVFFRYTEDGPQILKGVSLKIEPGDFVAFVGSSGCGKSTLMRLLLGFEKPGSGAIYYDGQDISTLDVRMLRGQLGVVLQESRVLPTDIYRNVVGTSSRTMDEAWEAAEMAGLAEDVRAMPMGMHTVVSEGGGTFSGGQRQRLLIARALVNKPRIIFLDEATSALDNRTQAIVSQSMDRLDATRIVIAHRLSTVVNANKIVYLDAGEVKEIGSYEELMAKDGLFAELARRQMA